MQDENDKLQSGDLLHDPTDGSVPMGDDTTPAGSAKTKSLSDQVDRTRDLINGRRDGTLLPIPTPWESLNKHLYGGLWPGLHVLVAPPKAGKTQFALQLALSAIKKGYRAYYIGLELTPEEVVARVYSLFTDGVIHWAKMLYGQHNSTAILGPDEIGAFKKTLTPLHYIHQTAYSWDFNELRGISEAARRESGTKPFLVIIDYLQLLQAPDGERWDMRERIGRAAYLGRQIARDYQGTVLAISSTARAGYGKVREDNTGNRGSPGDHLGAGKESGEIEYAADTVQVLVRDAEGYRFALAGGRACVPAWFTAKFTDGYKWEIGPEGANL
jgi:replicative DNA helicase